MDFVNAMNQLVHSEHNDRPLFNVLFCVLFKFGGHHNAQHLESKFE
jgi:hypothetical protein